MAFLSLEGIDGTGKTELVQEVTRQLSAFDLNPFRTRDPPDYEPWKRIKSELLDRENELDPLSEALLFLSARVDNTKAYIQPALLRNQVVVSDRYADSWIAYQTPRLADRFGGRGKAFDYLLQTHTSLVRAGMMMNPDCTVLIDDDPGTALRRVSKSKRSKFETEEYLGNVREAYLRLAEKFPARIHLVEVENDDLDSALDKSMQMLVDYARAEG